jgi:hypothetical protein
MTFIPIHSMILIAICSVIFIAICSVIFHRDLLDDFDRDAHCACITALRHEKSLHYPHHSRRLTDQDRVQTIDVSKSTYRAISSSR